MDLCQPKAITPASLPTSTDPPKQLPTAPTRKLIRLSIFSYLTIFLIT